MRKSLVLFSIFASSLFVLSCKKDKVEPVTYPIVGLWIGTYVQTSGDPSGDSLYYSYDLRADSTVLTVSEGGDGNTYYGQGKWTLSGTSFSALISTTNLGQEGAEQIVTAIYNKSNGTLTSGKVENIGNPFRANFSLSRIN
jgi:hypothetical protein